MGIAVDSIIGRKTLVGTPSLGVPMMSGDQALHHARMGPSDCIGRDPLMPRGAGFPRSNYCLSHHIN
jgi:hypothetical protein